MLETNHWFKPLQPFSGIRSMAKEIGVTVSLAAQREVEALGRGFQTVWPLDETPAFQNCCER